MRLRFSRRTDYALRAALELARHDQLVKRRDIAVAIDAPTSVVAQALADLVRAEVATGVAGRHGGYRLRRRADEISVLDVVQSVEPPATETRCVLHERVCPRVGRCPLHETIWQAQRAFHAELARETLAAVVGRLATPQAPSPRDAARRALASH